MPTLLLGRFITAIGSSAGLVCTFIILNNSVEPSKARVALSFATISFALSVSLSTLIGGLINAYSHWNYCFYILLVHGVIMFGVSYLYINNKDQDYQLNIVSIINSYKQALSSSKLIVFSLTIGVMSVFSYCYSTAGPFIVHDMFGFDSATYGVWNIMTMAGIVVGSMLAAKVINKYHSRDILVVALITLILLFAILAMLQVTNIVTPTIFFVVITSMYFVCNFIYPTASHLASNAIECRASASSAMNFVNMSMAVISVSVMGYLPFKYLWSFIVVCVVLPAVCLLLIFKFKAK